MNDVNLIRKIAWSFHRSTGLDWDDLFQEGYLAYMLALKTYDPTKNIKITTHAWHCIVSHLKNYLKEEKGWRNPLDHIDDIKLTKHPAVTASPFWEGLSDDAQQIADLIIRRSAMFIGPPPHEAYKRIYATMEGRGWSRTRTRKGIKELTLSCHNQ